VTRVGGARGAVARRDRLADNRQRPCGGPTQRDRPPPSCAAPLLRNIATSSAPRRHDQFKEGSTACKQAIFGAAEAVGRRRRWPSAYRLSRR
jgi:hypothetical protein